MGIERERSGPPSPKIGIIGGGQLARMLVEAAGNLGLQTRVYAQSSDESATFVTENFILGSLADETRLAQFFNECDLITFENEFIDIPTFERARAQSIHHSTLKFIPSLRHLSITQDKLEQKKIFQQLKLPSAPFEEGPLDPELLKPWVLECLKRWPQGVVFKWARFGYDGKGNFKFTGKAQDQELDQVLLFLNDGLRFGGRIYGEACVSFRQELAIQCAHRTNSQELTYFPLVITTQENGICSRVLGPATRFGVPRHLEAEAQEMARAIAITFGLEGLFAIELFETAEGDLLINEIAPRVHNSAHYSEGTTTPSQFEAHLLAVLGRPIPVPKTPPVFAMINLLGPKAEGERSSKSPSDSEAWLEKVQAWKQSPPANSKLTWYQKAVRPHRKLGHVSFWSDSEKHLNDIIKKWDSQSNYEIQKSSR